MGIRITVHKCMVLNSLRSWRDFARECCRFGCEDVIVNGSGEAVGGLVKSRVAASPLSSRASPAMERSPALASRQLRRLGAQSRRSFVVGHPHGQKDNF